VVEFAQFDSEILYDTQQNAKLYTYLTVLKYNSFRN